MNKKVNFEKLADECSKKANSGQPISRCDWLEIDGTQVQFVEDTHLTHPRNPVRLWEDDVFQKHVRENVCKMWGSFAVWQWAVAIGHRSLPTAGNQLERIFVLRFPSLAKNRRLARPIKRLIETFGRVQKWRL